jgi:hypothetical protein
LLARPARPISLFDRFLNRQVSVDMFVAKPETDAFASVVDSLCRLTDTDPDDLYAQADTHEQLKARLRAATTPDALIQAANTI